MNKSQKVVLLGIIIFLIVGTLTRPTPNDSDNGDGTANNASSDVAQTSGVIPNPVKQATPKIFYCPSYISCDTDQINDCDIPTTNVWSSVVLRQPAIKSSRYFEPGGYIEAGEYVLKSVVGLLQYANNLRTAAACIYTRPSKTLDLKNEIYLFANAFSLRAAPDVGSNHWEIRKYAKGRKGFICLPSRGEMYDILKPKLCPLEYLR